MGFATVVVPAAGVVISQGGGQDAVRVLDQVFREPALYPVFFGGLLYDIGLIIMSVAVWRSQTLSRWAAALLAAAGVLGVPALDVNVFQRIVPLVFVAALLALAAAIWRHPATGGSPRAETAVPGVNTDPPQVALHPRRLGGAEVRGTTG